MTLILDLELFKDGATRDMYYRDATGELVPVGGTPGPGKVPTAQAAGTVIWAAVSGSGAGGSGAGHWEPVTNGDAATPEIAFTDGDVVMTWVDS